MSFEITSKKTTGVERQLSVTVPSEQVRDAEERAARRYASTVRLPGFRPGKAPPAVVRKRFADAIRQQAVESLVQEAYQEAIGREQLKPIGQPHVHDLKFEEGKPLTFELRLEIRPEVALARTRDFASSGRSVRSRKIRSTSSSIVCVRTGRRGPQSMSDPGPTDMVTVVLSTADDSGALGEGKEYRLVLGSGQAIPASKS